MPPALKAALVREVARVGGNLNDVATGLLAERFGIAYVPTGRRSPLAGAGGVALLRMPVELKQRIEAEARSTESTESAVILDVLAEGLDIPHGPNGRKEEMASTDGSKNGDETDVDCGGSCPSCAPADCTDGSKNGDDTDVD